jgi:hypothetical protein
MENKLHYITIATVPNKVLDALQQNVMLKNELLLILGGEENRLIGWESSQNFGVKLKYVAEFLRAPFLQLNDVVLFTDAYDVAYFGSREQVMERFLEIGKPIVFGSEKFCNPDPGMASFYSNIDTVEFPFLNSGMFLGYVWALRECMGDYQYNDSDDDQRFWTRQYFVRNSLFALDYENRLFLNTAGVDENEVVVVGGGYAAALSYRNKNPLFVHVNGPDKQFIHKLVEYQKTKCD